MGDEDTAYITAFCSLMYDGIKKGGIVNGRINHRRALDSSTKYYRIRARTRHKRGVGCKDNCIWIWHASPPSVRLTLQDFLPPAAAHERKKDFSGTPGDPANSGRGTASPCTSCCLLPGHVVGHIPCVCVVSGEINACYAV